MSITRRTVLGIMAAAPGVAALSAPAIVRAAPRYNWRFAHAAAIGSDQDEFGKRFAALVEEKTGGTAVVSNYPAGQLGGEQDLFQQVRGQALEFCIQGLPGIANLGVKEAMLLDLPYVVEDRDQGWALLKGEFGEWMSGLIESTTSNRPLAYLDNGFRNVFNKNRPVEKPEDLAGLRLRVLQAPGYVTVYEHFEAVPVPLAYPEVYSALEAGVIDGGESSPKQMMQDRFFEVAKFYSLTQINYNPVVFLTNGRFFSNLPEDIQQAIAEAAEEAVNHQSEVSRRMDADMLVQMKERGVAVNQPDLAAFVSAARPAVWDVLASQIPNGEENIARLLSSLDALG